MRQFRAGNVDVPLSTRMTFGSVPAAILGVISLKYLERHLGSNFELRGALAVVLLGAGLGMLSKAGVAIPSAALAIAPVIVIGLVGGAVLKERGASGPLRQVGVRA